MSSTLLRIQYLCERHFGGNIGAFARAVKIHRETASDILRGKTTPQMLVLIKLIRSRLVNAEWLLCGTGPISPDEPGDALPHFALASEINSSHAFLDSAAVQFVIPRPVQAPRAPGSGKLTNDALLQARLIHQARSHHKPVVLFLGREAVEQNVGPVVVQLLRKGYVTGVALSSAAAALDFEQAIFGGHLPDSSRRAEMAELNRAAVRGAQSGLGYGEALGRWSYPASAQRDQSVIAVAYELNVPATIHLALGDTPAHFFPANNAAELGAALGAVSYVDTLIFAEEVRQMAGTPSGVFLAADTGGHSAQLFANVLEAVHSDKETHINDSTLSVIGREYRHTLPALLTACDAVYDGSADDNRLRRK
jgi:hypothetical protein